MSHLSNGSSPSGSGHSNCHNYTNGDVDYHKIAQICLAGLREASNGQKEMCERCDVLEQSIAELRSDMDLRISPLESSHQAMHTLLHENETLKHSLTLLSKSIDPAWKASIEARLTNHDLLAQKLQQMEEHMTAMARLLEAKTERTSGMNLDPSHVTSSPQTQRPVSHVPLPVLAAPSTSNPSLSSPVASPRSGTQAASPKPVTPPKAVHSPTVPLDKVVIEQVINKKSQYAEVLSACSDMLVNLGKASGNEGQLDEMLEQDLSALSRIDLSTPLVDKKAFDHKRDWVQAWQQALEQVQSSFIRSEEVITRKAAAIQARETELKQNERMVMEAGARLKDVISGIQEDCEAIASVKAMQEDHEEELLKRLRQVEEQEAMIRQDGYIMSIKGKRAYEKDAAEFRRIEELRSLKRELENRIQLAIEYEQQLVHSGRRGGATGHLPATDDLPNI